VFEEDPRTSLVDKNAHRFKWYTKYLKVVERKGSRSDISPEKTALLWRCTELRGIAYYWNVREEKVDRTRIFHLMPTLVERAVMKGLLIRWKYLCVGYEGLSAASQGKQGK
jgi:hypothetical protein